MHDREGKEETISLKPDNEQKKTKENKRKLKKINK